MSNTNRGTSTLPTNQSITKSPIFEALYTNNEENQKHFAKTKDTLPLHLVESNIKLAQAIHKLEKGTVMDWDFIETSIKRLEQDPDLQANLPGALAWFQNFLVQHKEFVKVFAHFVNYDLWFNMIEAYYTPTGDIALKALFPVTTGAEMEKYLQQAEEHMAPARVSDRHGEYDAHKSRYLAAERAFLALKETETAIKRYNQLRQITGIFDQSHDRPHALARLARMREVATQNVDRRRIQGVLRARNLRRHRFQLGVEGSLPMTPAMENLLDADGVTYTANYVGEEIPDNGPPVDSSSSSEDDSEDDDEDDDA